MKSSNIIRYVLIISGVLVTICIFNIALISVIRVVYPDLFSSPVPFISTGDTIDGAAENSLTEAEIEDLLTPIATSIVEEAQDTEETSEEIASVVETDVEPTATAEPEATAIVEDEPIEDEPEPTPVPTEPAPPTATPIPVVETTCGPFRQEAEEGELFGYMGLNTDEDGDIYVYAPAEEGTVELPEQAIENRVDFCFGVQQAGFYRLSGRMFGPTDESNSFFVSINQNFTGLLPWHTFPIDSRYVTEYVTNRDGDIPSSNGQPFTFYLDAGDQIVSVHHREAETWLDYVTLELVATLENAEAPIAEEFYVSLNGSNGDGRSWETAWSSFEEIDWRMIGPGDTVYIDGGEQEMVYESTLSIQRSGSENNPIRFVVSEEEGHNGQVVLFGGRDELLPECNSPFFVYEQPEYEYGIVTNEHDWLVFEGQSWYGITIHGYDRAGIRVDKYSDHITIRNMEITNNGFPIIDGNTDTYTSDGPGIRLGGTNITIERMVIHDNGQDAIQASWDYFSDKNVTIRQSWLYNGRKHSDYRGSWNWCTHTDSFQVYQGFEVRNITFEEVFLGPGLTNSVILGDKDGTHVQNLSMRNVVISKPDDNGLNMYTNPSQNVLLENVTFDCQEAYYNCLRFRGGGHIVRDSIFVGGNFALTDDIIAEESGNCIWNVTGLTFGDEVEVQFLRNSPGEFFSNDDYTLAPDSPCQGKGSSLTSIDQLFSLP